MKEKTFNTFIIIISLFVLWELIVKKSIIYSSIMYALNMWVNKLLPTLFPFFIISDILINYNITTYIPKIIKKICKDIFRISDNMLTILLLSMISGFPSNARNARILYDSGKIGADEANHILMFSNFANPLFILNTVGIFFFESKNIGIILLVIHYLSNFILGILLRNMGNYDNKVNDSLIENNNFGVTFILAIKKAIDTIITICGIVTVFLILSSLIINTFNFSNYNQMIIKGIFEITIGLEHLSSLNINLNYKIIIASMILAFGGISTHFQVLNQIADTKIKYSYFLIGRIFQMTIAGIMAYLYCLIMRI